MNSSIFGDVNRPSPDRLVALESLEPELLDVTDIGRALLALKGALLSDQSDDIIRKGALESIGTFSQNVPQHFQNFTAPMVVTCTTLIHSFYNGLVKQVLNINNFINFKQIKHFQSKVILKFLFLSSKVITK